MSETIDSGGVEHGERKGRHYYTTPWQADSSVNIVVVTLALAMLECHS